MKIKLSLIITAILFTCITSCSEKNERVIKQINTISETYESSVGFWEYDTTKNIRKKADFIKNFIIDTLYRSYNLERELRENSNVYRSEGYLFDRSRAGDFGFGNVTYFTGQLNFAGLINQRASFNIDKEKIVNIYWQGAKTKFSMINSDTGVLNNNYYFKKYIFSYNYGPNFFDKLYKNYYNLRYNLDASSPSNSALFFDTSKSSNVFLFENSEIIDNSILRRGVILGIKDAEHHEIENLDPYRNLQIKTSGLDTINILLPKIVFNSSLNKLQLDTFYNNLIPGAYVFFKYISTEYNNYLTNFKIIKKDYKEQLNDFEDIGFIGMGNIECLDKVLDYLRVEKKIDPPQYGQSLGEFRFFLTNESSPYYKIWTNSKCQVIGEEIQAIRVGDFEVIKQDFQISMNWEEANKACKNLGSDWRLPTKDELNVLYLNKNLVGGFDMKSYWSSTEGGDKNLYWGQSFNDGFQSKNNKNDGHNVRAVRTIK